MENWRRGGGWGGKKHKNITEPHTPNSNMADNTCTWLGQIMKSRLLRKHLGEQVAIIWYIVWKHRLYLHYFTIYLHIIDMPTSCCVPQCNQQGFTTPTGEKVSYFSFPSLLLRRKQWIDAIRREEGKNFKLSPSATKFCSLHLRPEKFSKISERPNLRCRWCYSIEVCVVHSFST